MKKLSSKNPKSSLILRGFGLLTSLAFLLSSGIVFAQKIPQTWSTNSYKPPKNIGKPTNTLPGGIRGSILSMIPVLPQVENTYFGVTKEAYPTFLIYIPELNPEIKYAKFSLKDTEGNEVYNSDFVLNTGNQIIAISLPKDAGLIPLEIGQDYEWNFLLFSDSLRINTPKMNSSGLVRRVELPSELKNQENLPITDDKQTRLTQARLYAEAEIWYDSAANLAKLYREYPDDLDVKKDWDNLLNSAKLNGLINIPLFSSAK